MRKDRKRFLISYFISILFCNLIFIVIRITGLRPRKDSISGDTFRELFELILDDPIKYILGILVISYFLAYNVKNSIFLNKSSKEDNE